MSTNIDNIIVLVDFAEQAVKLIHPLFVFFYLFLLCGQFVSAFRKGGVYLPSDKYPLKLL